MERLIEVEGNVYHFIVNKEDSGYIAYCEKFPTLLGEGPHYIEASVDLKIKIESLLSIGNDK